MHSFLLSIIIPTKNRQYYCLYAIRQILSLGLSDLEICIQDNSDTDDLRNEIAKFGVENIVYNYHEGVLSFVDNFSEAVSLSHGDYVCVIGDDDGVMPSIRKFAEKARSEDLDAIIPSLGFGYIWPSKEKIVDNAETGLLDIYVSGKGSRLVDPQKALDTLLYGAVQNYTTLDIPRLYHGLVKREILESVKNKTGVYFGGLTPDMYMAGALAIECKKVLRVYESVTIAGVCPTSGSADSVTGRHTGNLSDAPHFRGHSNYIWNDKIPAFYSVDTIWADTLLHVLTAYGRMDLVDKFNLPLFESICTHKYPEYKKLIIDHALSHGISTQKVKTAYPILSVKNWSRKTIRAVKLFLKSFLRRKKRFAHLSGIPDIITAQVAIEEFVKSIEA